MIRQPVASGKYYSSTATSLRAELQGCLAEPAANLKGGPCLHCSPEQRRHLRGLIVPHGSTSDSGFAAAAAYLALKQQIGLYGTRGHPGLPRPLRFVVLGTNHFTNLPLACLSTAAAWRTPLGDVPVDADLNAALQQQGLPFDDTPHNLEHSIENQLPFLQHMLESVPNPGRYGRPLSIAPVCVGWLGSGQQAQQLGRQLLAALRQAQAQHPDQAPPLLIATSDFTHAGPAYNEPPDAPWMSLREHCIWRDSPLLHAVCMGGAERFLEMCAATGTSLCGRWPVAAFLCVAQAAGWEVELLSYAPSDLYVSSGNINGFAAFAAWQTLHSTA